MTLDEATAYVRRYYVPRWRKPRCRRERIAQDARAAVTARRLGGRSS